MKGLPSRRGRGQMDLTVYMEGWYGDIMIQKRFEVQNAYVQAFDDSVDYGWDITYQMNQEGSSI